MAIKDVLKVNRKTFFNPSAWIGYNNLKTTTKTIWSLIRGLFVPAKPEVIETFEEAIQRLNLTEQELIEKQSVYLNYAYGFLILAICSFIAGFYLLLHHSTILGWLLAIAVTTLFLSQAFRYHFWQFQMKHRKLGCTWEEWRRGKINNNGETTP